VVTLAFVGNERRKNIKIKSYAEIDSIEIPIDKMILKGGNRNCYIYRLGYKGCLSKKYSQTHKDFVFSESKDLIDMNRWGLVKYCFGVLLKMDRSERTKINVFDALQMFFEHCDIIGSSVEFNRYNIVSFIDQLRKKYLDGIKGKTITQIQACFKSFLNEVDPNIVFELRDEFLILPSDIESTKPYTDNELKEIVKALYIIFNTYRKHVLSETAPNVHPFLCNALGKNYSDVNFNGRHIFYVGGNNERWKNDLVKSAFYLTCFYTGLNESELINLKFSDI